MDPTRRAALRTLGLALAAGCAGCGYSLAGRGSFLPAHIRSIGVPLFKNHTNVFDVERRITERVVSELIGRGKYRVVTGNEPTDAVLEGEITSITISPASLNDQRLATRYAVVLTARVEFRDLKDNKVLWSNPAMQFREEYDISGTVTDPNAFFGQDMNALDRLAAEFARTLISAILEAF
ncbi:MAG TPA: LptE family protein [Vicinamibacterales bacterium]|nr:LptE family protein [Vicinamibacterales bacterium]